MFLYLWQILSLRQLKYRNKTCTANTFLSQDREEHEHMTNSKVTNALLDDGFKQLCLAVYEKVAMKEWLCT